MAANHIPLNALSLKLLPFFGTTNDPGGNVVTNFPTTNKSDNVLAKIDYTINSHHTLSGTYFLGTTIIFRRTIPVSRRRPS